MKKNDMLSYGLLAGAFLVVGIAAWVYFKTDRQLRNGYFNKVEAWANGEHASADGGQEE